MKNFAVVALLLMISLLGACEEPQTTQGPPENPAVEQPAEKAPAQERPAPAEEPAGEEVAPPTVSEDAPFKQHMGEPPFPSQPQPVYPEGEPGDAAEPTDAMDTDTPAGEAAEE